MDDKNRFPLNRPAPEINDELNEIWEMTGSARGVPPLEDAEVERTLQKVNNRIDQVENTGKQKPLYVHIREKSRYLVAAVALIVVGAYFLFLPVTVSVPPGEIASIELPDGSEAELNSGTVLKYSRLFGVTHRNLSLNGEAFFSVQPSGAPFKVEANSTIAEVTGTRFNIRSWRDDPFRQTTITVTEGSVEFYTVQSAGQKIRLTPGNLSLWNSQMDSPSEPNPVSVDDITGWRNNRLVFLDQPLAVILNELERRFNIQIDLEIPGAEQETLTAYYTNPGNAQTVLEDISTVKGFRYSKTSSGYRIFK